MAVVLACTIGTNGVYQGKTNNTHKLNMITYYFISSRSGPDCVVFIIIIIQISIT